MNKKSIIAAAVLALSASLSRADVTFTFSQVGADVVMTSSGTLNIANLLSSSYGDGWGGTGIENNATAGDIDIMGGTSFGVIDTLFKFNSGTDASAITTPNGPFSFSNFGWAVTSGSTSFSTYSGFLGGFRQPGIGMRAADIISGLWTPNQNWINTSGTFASLGLNLGTYAVSDRLTGETITIQVGESRVPDGGTTLALLGGTFLGLAALRRRFVS